MLRIKKVKYLDKYRLNILFSNGRSKIVDFKDWISEANVYLKPLRSIEYFKKVRIDDAHYSICWPNGADFSPDILFEVGHENKTKPASRSKRAHKPKRLKKN